MKSRAVKAFFDDGRGWDMVNGGAGDIHIQIAQVLIAAGRDRNAFLAIQQGACDVVRTDV